MAKAILALDIDGVFADFLTPYASLLARVNGKDLLPFGWKRDKGFLWAVDWNWEGAYGYSQKVVDEVWRDHILPSQRFWRDLPLLGGARLAARTINYLARSGAADVYFVTARPGTKATAQTEDWLVRIGIHNPTVLLSSNKIPILIGLGATHFIDDKPDTIKEAVAAKLQTHLYLKRAPYNQRLGGDGFYRVWNVKEMLDKEGLWR